MRLTKPISILGEPHEIEYTSVEDGNDGTYSFGVIRISNKGTPRQQARSVLHEFAHGIFRSFEEPDSEVKEENFARMFELGVSSLVRENHELMRRLEEVFLGEFD